MKMKARIGVVDNAKVVEIEIDDPDGFRAEIERAFGSSQQVFWFTDVKNRTVGIPLGRIAFVEIDAEDGVRRVGFAP